MDKEPLRFAYESTGKETQFTDYNDPKPRSREVFSFHQPAILKEWMNQGRSLRDQFSEIHELLNPEYRFKRKETWSEDKPDGCWWKFTYEEIIVRDKTSLDIFWLKDESLGDLENLPDPDVLAKEITENLEEGLESFRAIINKLNENLNK